MCHMTSSNLMETFSALLALCASKSPVTGEFPSQRPVTRSLDVFFDLRLNKRFSKQSWGWWFEKQLHSLWRHCNGCMAYNISRDLILYRLCPLCSPIETLYILIVFTVYRTISGRMSPFRICFNFVSDFGLLWPINECKADLISAEISVLGKPGLKIDPFSLQEHFHNDWAKDLCTATFSRQCWIMRFDQRMLID